MAVNGMDAPRRRVVFGFNVLVQAVLAVAVVVVAIWVADRFKVATDMTGAGRNSLSSRTTQLLRGLDQDVRVTAVFPEPDKRDTLGQKRRRQMQDLLDLYQSAGGARVSTTLLDPTQQKAQTDKLLQRLLELPAYKDEAKPHQEALTKFAALSEQIKALVADEAKKLEELTRGDAQLSKNRNLGVIRVNLRDIATQAQEVMEKVDQLAKGEMPQFGQAVKAVKDYATSAETFLRDAQGWMTGEGLSTSGITPELRAFFESAAGRYEPVVAEARTLLEKTKDLKEVKVEELYRNLTQWRTSPPVLVESAREARVVSNWDIWVPPAEPGAPVSPDGDDRVFAGEAAISSAVLQLTQKDKTGVIFVRYGGPQLLTPDFSKMNQMMRQMPRAPYQELNQLLTKAGFQTAEWNVQEQKTPPAVEGVTRKIYVVLRPEPPQQNPMQPMPPPGMKPEDRKLVLDAVDQAGCAVFLAGWAEGAAPIPGMGGNYEYADYLKTSWGIDVLARYLTLHFAPHPEKPGTWVPASRQPQVLTTDDVLRMTAHPIGAPLAADRAAFVLAAPLGLPKAESMPAGVKAEVVAEVKPTQDVWACGDLPGLEEQFKRRQGVTPGEKDIRAPFPLVVAATKSGAATQPAGAASPAPAERKVVVFSSDEFVRDEFAQASGLSQVGNKLVLGPLYPANSDLFINALHWLTGDANRIAVGPRRGETPRLKKLDEAWAGRLPWLLVGVWPALALVAGVGVWAVRRK